MKTPRLLFDSPCLRNGLVFCFLFSFFLLLIRRSPFQHCFLSLSGCRPRSCSSYFLLEITAVSCVVKMFSWPTHSLIGNYAQRTIRQRLCTAFAAQSFSSSALLFNSSSSTLLEKRCNRARFATDEKPIINSSIFHRRRQFSNTI